MNKLSKFLSIIILGIIMSCNSLEKSNDFDSQGVLDYCVNKTRETLSGSVVADGLPRNILQGGIQWNKVGIHDWCSGFWPGILWYAYEASGDKEILENARDFTESLKGVLDVPVDNHDLGFMLYSS